MSVRFFRIFSCVLFLHLAVLSLVWVGFSAPLPRFPVTFVYQGAMPADDTGEQMPDTKENLSGQLVLDHLKASYFNPWINLRELDKTK